MISNQILQTTVDGLKAISRVDFCVIDADGKVAAKTFCRQPLPVYILFSVDKFLYFHQASLVTPFV